jgi:hypothetical protein
MYYLAQLILTTAQGVQTVTTLKEAFQAGIETGRNIMKLEMDALAKFDAAGFAPFNPDDYSTHGNGSRKRPGRKAKAAKDLTPTPIIKAPKVARVARKSSGPRTKGVKEAIVNLIKERKNGMFTAEIIAKTGFKATSVRATLMSLKKDGIAVQDGSFWIPVAPSHDGDGNSDSVGMDA